MNKYYILCTNNNLLEEAKWLANFTQKIEVLTNQNQVNSLNKLPYLILDESGLSINCNSFNSIYIEYIYNKITSIRQNLEQELLIKAIKIKNKPKTDVTILDLTAGLAKDGLIIAKYGYNLIMIEQNPLLATIIYYAIQKNLIPNNAKIICMNSLDYLQNNQQNLAVDAIYLDPMFNHKKSAKAKKDMQIIQLIHDKENYNTNENILFEEVIKTQVKKIVIKRDNKQLPIVSDISKFKPSFNKLGKTIRYDIYINNMLNLS